MLGAAAVALAVALLWLAHAHARAAASKDAATSPTPPPARKKLDLRNLEGQEWTAAVPVLREADPRAPIAVLRRAPLLPGNSLETPALEHVTYVFVDGENHVTGISKGTPDTLVAHDGFVKTYPPLL